LTSTMPLTSNTPVTMVPSWISTSRSIATLAELDRSTRCDA
jgi:hypothetical protein